VPERADTDPYRNLLPSLEVEFASLLNRHKEAAEKGEWSYHEFLPLGALQPTACELSPTAYLAVETALLTEVNLPWYTSGLTGGLQSCPGPIREFVRVWTAEEDQHATLLEGYLLLSGSGDHGARARARKGMIAAGWNHALSGPFEGMVYTAIQEAATRAFYLCAARACSIDHPPLAAALRRIAKDETLHMAFYRDVVQAHLDADSNYLCPLTTVVMAFEMPWSASVLGDFEQRRSRLAASGVFRLNDYVEDVLQPLCSYWRLEQRAPASEETRQAQLQLRRYRAALRKFARREGSASAPDAAAITGPLAAAEPAQ
jgi:acyl-[acyl-carrier-protein] desaturase